MREIEGETAGGGRAVPLEVDGQRVYLWVQEEVGPARVGQEDEIAWRPPSLDQVVDGLMGVARTVGERLKESGADKVNVEFGCEIAMESGSFVAVIGKASGRSTFKVALEWTQPA